MKNDKEGRNGINQNCSGTGMEDEMFEDKFDNRYKLCALYNFEIMMLYNDILHNYYQTH